MNPLGKYHKALSQTEIAFTELLSPIADARVHADRLQQEAVDLRDHATATAQKIYASFKEIFP